MYTMKRTLFIVLALIIGISASAQFVARMQVKGDIAGICDKKEVYVLMASFKGQIKAVCSVTNDSILKRLNSEVVFVKENPNYSDKGMVGVVINCKGEVVQCEMDNKTKKQELDKQIVTVFNSLGGWKAGKLNGHEVDSSRLFSFKINNGVFSF